MSKPKLFIFGIGGTGSRVIKSLTMLLAAGVDIEASEVIPIIIDPHQQNDDLRRTLSLLNNYQTIYNRLDSDNRTDFFKTIVQTLQQSTDDKALQNTFTFSLQNVDTQSFRDYIDYDNLDESNKALATLLFSDKNLNTKMDIGFVGNQILIRKKKRCQGFIGFIKIVVIYIIPKRLCVHILQRKSECILQGFVIR